MEIQNSDSFWGRLAGNCDGKATFSWECITMSMITWWYCGWWWWWCWLWYCGCYDNEIWCCEEAPQWRIISNPEKPAGWRQSTWAASFSKHPSNPSQSPSSASQPPPRLPTQGSPLPFNNTRMSIFLAKSSDLRFKIQELVLDHSDGSLPFHRLTNS